MANQSRHETVAEAVLLLAFIETAGKIAQALSPADPFIRYLIRMIKKRKSIIVVVSLSIVQCVDVVVEWGRVG